MPVLKVNKAATIIIVMPVLKVNKAATIIIVIPVLKVNKAATIIIVIPVLKVNKAATIIIVIPVLKVNKAATIIIVIPVLEVNKASCERRWWAMRCVPTCSGCRTHLQPARKAEMSGTTHSMLSSERNIVSASTSPNHTLNDGVKLSPLISSIATSPPPFNCNCKRRKKLKLGEMK